MKKQRLLSLTLSLAIIASSVPVFASNDSDTAATRGQVVNSLLDAADIYNTGVKKDDIIKGYGDGDLKENQPITRAESFVMFGRAFGDLPAPVGNYARHAMTTLTFSDVPDWAKQDVDKLIKAGILIGTDDGTMNANSNVTTGELDTMIRRAYALFGTNLKDDFYSTVNKTILDTSVIRPGEMSAGGFNDLQYQNQDRVTKIIEEMSEGSFKKGSSQQKISDFYKSALDVEGRNREGINPIKSYLNKIDASDSLDKLIEAQIVAKKEIGISPLVDFGLSPDPKSSNQYAVYLIGLTPSLTKDVYTSPIGDKQLAYIDYIETLLTLGGDEASKAHTDAQAYYDMEKTLSAKQMDPQEYGDIDKTYNLRTVEQLQSLYKNINIKDIIRASGLSVPEQIGIQDVELNDASALYFTDENLPLLKTCAKLHILMSYGEILDSRFSDASTVFSEKFYGVQGRKTTEELASMMTQGIMSTYLGKVFVEKYFSPEAKADVENMVSEFISIYKERITKLDWMSESTKQMAKKKLDTMTVKIGYPDKWNNTLDSIDIVGPSTDSNSLFENYRQITLKTLENMVEKQNKPVDKDEWMLSVYTVNAYYMPTSNEIVFPAGILQAPFYDVNQKREANLGGIGMVIAHEITHAFDNNGAKYDENGNAANWWTESDYEKFQTLCDEATNYYDGIETAPGILNNGKLTLSENIADLGGMACAIAAMNSMENPDYDAFFRNNAHIWALVSSREYTQYLNQGDVHSANNIRTNRTVSAFEEFHKTYGTAEGDGMYVPTEKRVKIW